MAFLWLALRNRARDKPCKPSWGPCLQDTAELCKTFIALRTGIREPGTALLNLPKLPPLPQGQGISAYTMVALCFNLTVYKPRFYLEDTTISGRLNEPPFGDSKLNSCVIQSKALLLCLLLSFFVSLFKTIVSAKRHLCILLSLELSQVSHRKFRCPSRFHH